MHMQEKIRIETFGAFRILCPTHPYEEITFKGVARTGPPLTFLKVLLATEPQLNNQKLSRHQASKDIVIDALWPKEESAPTDINNALANAKSTINRVIRSIIGQDLILLTRGSDNIGYQLNASIITIDADEFEQSVIQANQAEGRGDDTEALYHWEAAYALVAQGSFLPEDQYNEWSRHRRERIASRYRQCLHQLATFYVKHNRIIEATDKLHPYLLTHPAETDLLVILLPLLAQQRRHQEALQLLSSYKKELDQDGKSIEQELIDLEEQLYLAQKAALVDLTQTLHQRGQELSDPNMPHMLQYGSQAVFPAVPDLSRTFPLTRLIGYDLWFGEKLGYLLTLIEDYSGQQCSDLDIQEKIGKELYTMPPKPDDKGYTHSRRQFLVALATLPTALFLSMLQEQRSSGRIEQFLIRCEASLAACWHLMGGSEYVVVEEILPTYLPLLARVAQEPSKYQKKAASLATQGYRLRGILALHHNDSKSREAYFQQAVSYAEITQDAGLMVAALISLGYHKSNPVEAEQLYQQALLYKPGCSPLQHAHLYVELSVVSAQQNRENEARHYLDLAQQLYPDYPEDDANFLYAEFRPASMILETGRMYLALSQYQTEYTRQAWDTFASLTPHPSRPMISERIRYEIVNYQAETALALRDRDLCCDRILLGARGAQLLGSAKRRTEIVIVRNKALKYWSQDNNVKQLKSLFA